MPGKQTNSKIFEKTVIINSGRFHIQKCQKSLISVFKKIKQGSYDSEDGDKRGPEKTKKKTKETMQIFTQAKGFMCNQKILNDVEYSFHHSRRE